jgi:hypothetical protein
MLNIPLVLGCASASMTQKVCDLATND